MDNFSKIITQTILEMIESNNESVLYILRHLSSELGPDSFPESISTLSDNICGQLKECLDIPQILQVDSISTIENNRMVELAGVGNG